MKPIERPRRHVPPAGQNPVTTLLHSGTPTGVLSGPVSPPVYRFSTVNYDTVDAYEAAHHHRFDQLIYGRAGSPTLWALEDALCALEGAHDCVFTPSGLAAIQLALMSVLSAGDHLLVTDAVYGPVRTLCKNVLARFGIEVEFYDPLIGAGITALCKPNTRAVYVESPGTCSFEVQDIPAIAAAAHARGIVVIADNTWASGLYFKSFAHGVDISVHAGTKYIVGHSDAMLGAVLSAPHLAAQVRQFWSDTGTTVGPDEAFLGLRGVRTLAVRLERHYANALAVAQWLEHQSGISRVLYPALPSHPQHALWRRDFTGACGLVTIVPTAATEQQVHAFCDALQLFGIGASWGGYESLVLPAYPPRTASSLPWDAGQKVIRLHVGLEHLDDLLADLQGALPALQPR